MKMLFFTPLIKASAIGRMVCLVTKELAALGHEIVVVRTESASIQDTRNVEIRDVSASVVRWDDEKAVLKAAEHADIVVYQIGDNFSFHEGCLAWLKKLPGLVCLHDFFLGHFFYQWAQQNMAEANVVLRTWYGDDVAKQYFNFPTNASFIEGTRERAPMTEWIASQALGVITHSQWGTERVKQACTGPVRVVPLAYDAPGLDRADGAVGEEKLLRYAPRMNLLTMGYINRNKRVEQVIRAVASSAMLRDNVAYRLVGRIEPAMVLELSRLANAMRVNLLISGEVDDETLVDVLSAADVMSCLRWPSLEGSSASAIESMLYGKAAIVTDTGFYSEIPDDCVDKIDQDDEIANIRLALERLYRDAARRDRLGSNASAWAARTFSAKKYAEQIVTLAALCQMIRPVAHATAYFVGMLTQWSATSILISTERARLAMSEG